MNKIKVLLSKLPWSVWITATALSLVFTANGWYNHQLDDAEERGALRARVAYVRDSTTRVIAAKDRDVAAAKRTADKTTGRLSLKVNTLTSANEQLTKWLAEVLPDDNDGPRNATMDSVMIDTDSLAKLPDSTLVAVPMGLVRAADKVNHELHDLRPLYVADSVALADLRAKQDSATSVRTDALADANHTIDNSLPQKRSWWQKTKGAADVTLRVIGAVTVAVVTGKVLLR